MKKVIYLITVCLLLVGCGNVKKEETKEPEKEEKEVEKYSLVSTSDRLVFKSEEDDIYEIVYFEDETIVKVETAIKFKTPAEAEQYYKEESIGNSETISYMYDVFITEETEDYWEDYKDLNKENLEKYMQEANYIICLSL
ncbi:MAG: hypothetical protein J6Y42_03010 [Bacilli bacterium]|nr:hypothetical protein [Bacilli bacterium]